MTLAETPCPACSAPLDSESRFCAHCGLEVVQACPACDSAPRELPTLSRGMSPWCESCERLLSACERCGRWLLPGTEHCQDPQCAGLVLSPFPLQTGRRWEGGVQSDWVWPVIWEREHPQHALPRVDWWTSQSEVQAAFVAHGRCFVWETGTLVSPEEDGGWRPRDGAAGPGAVSWRSPLAPPIATAAKVPFEERVSVLGGRAILATAGGYAQADLRHPGDSSVLWDAVPLAQVTGPTGWAAWGNDRGVLALRVASVPVGGAPALAKAVTVLPGAALARRGRLVHRDGRVYWPGQDGSVWELELKTRSARSVWNAVDGLLDLWVGADGPRVVRESLGQIAVALTGPREGGANLTVPAGAGPLRGVYGLDPLLVVVGDRVLTFDARTGDRLHEALRPPGIWIGAVLVRTPDQEPRLLTLTRDNGFATLTVTRLSSGVHDLLWREPTLDPKALLPVDDMLYLVHSRGLLRFHP